MTDRQAVRALLLTPQHQILLFRVRPPQGAIGPLVWKRQQTFDWGDQQICQREDYYIVHVERFEPRMSHTTEIKYLDQFRWWSVAELAHSVESLTPRALPDIVARYLVDGPPRGPLAVEVLLD